VSNVRRYLSSAASWDAGIGVLAGLGALALASDDAVRAPAVTILLAAAGIGVALLGAVLTAMAIIATFADGHYRRVLEAASGSTARAMEPYLIVGFVSAVCTVVSLLLALGWPTLGAIPETVGLALSLGLCAWASAGAVQLVELTIFHAGQRSELLRGIEDADAIRSRRLSARVGRRPSEDRT
jgi:hypothetical protein